MRRPQQTILIKLTKTKETTTYPWRHPSEEADDSVSVLSRPPGRKAILRRLGYCAHGSVLLASNLLVS
jgi:hypothetical protein